MNSSHSMNILFLCSLFIYSTRLFADIMSNIVQFSLFWYLFIFWQHNCSSCFYSTFVIIYNWHSNNLLAVSLQCINNNQSLTFHNVFVDHLPSSNFAFMFVYCIFRRNTSHCISPYAFVVSACVCVSMPRLWTSGKSVEIKKLFL